ncbi:very-short-patch-repair endonuclease [Rhodoligotrophos appendicifer]|uniref:DUF3320 domain-containing protein n=1 Tax=Rhodoligotrophos appendicifer TaxID=987056 RepID=UPI001FE3D933|nr:DUF3320 domain-containing protein [Rhodoligotrophos appendicifer]
MLGETVKLGWTVSDYLSIAFYQNSIPVIYELTVENLSDRSLDDLVLNLRSEPAFAASLSINIDQVAAGSTRHIAPVDLTLEAGYLRRLNEGMRGTLSLVLEQRGTVLLENTIELQLHPPSHWGGSGAAPELLAAFVRPNEPVIDTILHNASIKLASAGKNSAIDGYQARKRERTWELANAIWAAIADCGLTYVLPPASFERSGQKVRSPGVIIERKTGTCLDLTLLYAACLEQAGLNGLLVLTKGHAFVGLWLNAEDFSTVAVDDMQVLRKRRDAQDLIFVETTLLTRRPAATFSAAIKAGSAHVDENGETLEIAVDVKRSRCRGIKPLELAEQPAGGSILTQSQSAPPQEIEEPPQFAENMSVAEATDLPIDRLERWKRKLLDLSLRNKLLNFKDAKKCIPIECPDPGALEDHLARGMEFKLHARTDVLGEGDQRDAALYRERHHDDGRQRYLVEALAKQDLHTFCGETELASRLTDLFRATNTAFEEGGSNILFLAMGFLKWTQKPSGPTLRAPLLLIPVALARKNVRAGFRLKLHEEEARFNPTLLQLLRQDFKLAIPELEQGLPTDESGIDVEKVWRIMRAHVRDLKGWEVTSDVILSTFSFTKFLMWKDLVERMETLKRSAIVRHLIDTPKQQYGDGTDFPDPAALDRTYHPADILTPLSSDSSQLAAVMAAAAGNDFVLFGPPGTGKSQTIANMISQCLASGKTVLFVAQKTAALEVVQRRLKDIGLGEYCLEVHSTKAQKSAVLGQLRQAWHERSAVSVEEWEGATHILAALRDDLNGLVSSLHRRRSNGLSAHDAMSKVIRARDAFRQVDLQWPPMEIDRDQLSAMQKVCRELKTVLRALGDVNAHPLQGLAITAWSPKWRQEMTNAIDEALNSMSALRESAQAFCQYVGLPHILSLSGLQHLVAFGAMLIGAAGHDGHLFLTDRSAAIKDAIGELTRLQKSASKLRKSLSAEYRSSVFSRDLGRILDDWTEASQSNIVLRGSRQRKVLLELEPFAVSPLPKDISTDLVILIELADIEANVEDLAPVLSALGDAWEGLDTRLSSLAAGNEWANRMRLSIRSAAPALKIDESDLREHVISLRRDYAHMFRSRSEALAGFEGLQRAWREFDTANKTLLRLAGHEAVNAFFTDENWMEDTASLLKGWQGSLGQANVWCQWTSARREAEAVGLQGVLAALDEGSIAPHEIDQAFEIAHARWWADTVISGDPRLCSFLATRQEDTIAAFQAADEQVRELSKRIVRSRLVGNIPGPNAFGNNEEWGFLARELAKKTRHQPLRQLFAKMPTTLTRLTPCVMMSPLSIAQYLPPDSQPFDVVIFDEASQIPVWDAIGALARGRQSIIVGDPQQLPPTNVGERGVDDQDDSEIEDQESILDEALASNITARDLNWHYRSRHESLIAFSNHTYYNGKLVTFPSPVTDDVAVRYVHVPGGVYERGAGRVNRKEAGAVVAEIVRRLKDPGFVLAKLSLGVVTFNAAQQKLIEDLLEQERRSLPDIELFFDAAQWHEPVFVKNLENVQGDERDIIFFSIAVGPDQAGRVTSTISSLNKEGGHRRLNVAITRARQEMVIFATLRPEQIDLSRTRARGVLDFKHFLEFAEHGPKAIAEAFSPTGLDPDSDFEIAVKSELESLGWQVHPQVGVSAFRIDLGIVDPDAPGRYLAGVECDGATYHRSATARDRDRLREQVLIGLGWRIRRVWSTDWWMDATKALHRLHGQLITDLEEARKKRAAREVEALPPMFAETGAVEPPVDAEGTDAPPNTVEDVIASSSNPRFEASLLFSEAEGGVIRADLHARSVGFADSKRRVLRELKRPDFPPYVEADLLADGISPNPNVFYDAAYRPKIRAMAAQILTVEAPLYEDILFQKIAKAHGFLGTGVTIRQTIRSALGSMLESRTENERRVVWLAGPVTPHVVPFRMSDANVRSHADIPICELASLAAAFLQEGGDEEEVVRRMTGLFSLSKLHPTTRSRFLAAIAANRIDGSKVSE